MAGITFSEINIQCGHDTKNTSLVTRTFFEHICSNRTRGNRREHLCSFSVLWRCYPYESDLPSALPFVHLEKLLIFLHYYLLCKQYNLIDLHCYSSFFDAFLNLHYLLTLQRLQDTVCLRPSLFIRWRIYFLSLFTRSIQPKVIYI